MLALLFSRLGRLGRFLWSIWAGMAGLCVFAAIWQVGHEAYGSFILPSPMTTLQSMFVLLDDPETWAKAGVTCVRALYGFVIAAFGGATAGIIVGYSPATLRLVQPILTILLGVPPIAWIVLAMIWFGSSDGTVIATIVVTSFALPLLSAAEGVMKRDHHLDDMARAYGANAWGRFFTLTLRQVSTLLFPSLVVTLGTAFKVAVMAELLANAGGIGGALARSRANLDIAEAMAWIVITVAALIVVEYGLIHPVKAEMERWREAAKPWGVKR